MEEPKFIITRKPTKEDFIQFNRVISDKEFHFKRSVTIVSIVIFVIWTDVLLSIHLQSKVLTAALFLLNILMIVFYNWNVRKRRDRKASKLYDQNKMFNSLSQIKLSLFDDHIETHTDLEQANIPYDKLYKIIETPTHFYFMYAKNQGIIIAKEGEAMTDFVLKLKEKYKL